MIGRKFNDEVITKERESWAFTVEADEKNRPVILIGTGQKQRKLYPEEVQAKILENVRRSAEMKANGKVEKCVITVPAYFNDSQKQSTKKAARIAGLDCKAIINEPTAAAICFSSDFSEEYSGTRKVLIFDFGGGTFDVSILDITGKDS